jgi:hypothetical protein
MGKQGKQGDQNVFRHTAGVVAHTGLHTATVVSTEYVGDKFTKHGQKDMQMFVLRVKQDKADGTGVETADIHQQFHRSFHPQSALVRFLAGFGIHKKIGDEIDFNDLVGQKVIIVVAHSHPDANGVVHANVIGTKPPVQKPERPSEEPEIERLEEKVARMTRDYGADNPVVDSYRQQLTELKAKKEGTQCKN